VALALDELRASRREHEDAARLVVVLSRDLPADQPSEWAWRRLCIERDAAAHRRGLWAAEVRRAEGRARALGLDVRSTL